MQLAADMRREDALEAFAALGLTPLEALECSLSVSPFALSLLVEGEVTAICGVTPWGMLGGQVVGNAWVLTGNGVTRRPRAFLRASKLVVAWMLEEYPILINFVDARYMAALRWVSWLGFTIGGAVPCGVRGEMFHVITMRREAWAQSQVH